MVSLAQSALSPYDSGLAVVLGDARHDLAEGSSLQTWVLAVTLNTVFADEDVALADSGHLDTLAFERCLAAVNRLIRAEQLLTRQAWSHPLTKESLDPLITYIDVGDDGSLSGRRRQLQLHHRPYNPRVISDDPTLPARVADALDKRLASDAAQSPHPLVLARELRTRATSYQMYGDASSAVLTLQTAAETYLRGMHRLLLVDRGLTGAEVAHMVKCSFRSLLDNRFPSLLGGSWAAAGSAPEIYCRALYDLRNAVIHRGDEPSWRHVQSRFDAYDGLAKFVEDRVLASWRSKPRTLLAMIAPWAGGTRDAPRAASRIIAELLGEAMPYWLPWDEAGRSVTS